MTHQEERYQSQDMQDEAIRRDVAFIGSTLAPFFLHDPALEADAILPLLEALSAADPDELSINWPFVDAVNEATVRPSLSQLTEGASLCFAASETDERLEHPHTHAVDTNELARDYRRLFVGPAQKAAPQWGSVYTDKDAVTFGGSTMQLEEWLAENGIAISFGASDEPPDSLGALLALLAWLADEKPWLVADFLRLHVLPWSSHFLDLMEKEAEHSFYKGLAGVTRFSLESAGEAFDLTVEKPRFYR